MTSYSTDGLTPVPQVLAQTWHTKIPFHLSLAPDNISSPSAVRPIYLMAPRQGYLHVVATQAWPHLQHVLPSVPGRPGPPRPWFDCRGVPLKWHLPCGVLYDLFADAGQLPWPLTVHYTHPPDSLAGWDTGATPQSQFMNSLKEACYICRGPDGSGSVMRMGSAAQDELWSAVQAGDVGAYRSVLEGLRIAPTQRQGNPPNIPVRLLLRRATPAAAPVRNPPTAAASSDATAAASTSEPQAPPAAGATGAVAGPRPNGGGGAASVMASSVSGAAAGGAGVWESCITATSRPVPALQGVGGPPTTLAQLLHVVLPHIFPEPPPELLLPEGVPQPVRSESLAQGEATKAAASAAVAPTAHGTAAVAGATAAQNAAAESRSGAIPEGPSGGNRGDDRVAETVAQQQRPPGVRDVVERGGSDLGARDEEGRSGEAEAGAGAASASGREGTSGEAAAAATGHGGGGREEDQWDANRDGDGTTSRVTGLEDTRPTAAEGMTTALSTDPDGAGEAREMTAPESSSTRAAGVSVPSETDGAGARGDNTAAASGPTVQSASAAAGGAGGAPAAAGAGSSGPGAGRGGGGQRAPRWPACRVLVGGICPPLGAPVGWLHAAMHAPDLFLYVVVRMDGEAGAD